MTRIERPPGVIYVRRRRLLSLALFAAASALMGAAVGLGVDEEGRAVAAAAAGLLTLFALIALADQRAVVIDLRRSALLSYERHPFGRVEHRSWPIERVSVRLEGRAPGGPRLERVWILVPGEPPLLFLRRWRRSARMGAERLASDLGRPLTV